MDGYFLQKELLEIKGITKELLKKYLKLSWLFDSFASYLPRRTYNVEIQAGCNLFQGKAMKVNDIDEIQGIIEILADLSGGGQW